MGWVRLDDNYPHHPKVVGLSDAALALEVRALCWSARYETDGFVSFQSARLCSSARTRVRAINELVHAGRWRLDEEHGGYWIHDFLDYNPSSKDQKAKREAAAERMRRQRRSPDVRANNQQGSREVPAKFPRSSRTPNPPSRREGLGEEGGVSGGRSARPSDKRPTDPAATDPTAEPDQREASTPSPPTDDQHREMWAAVGKDVSSPGHHLPDLEQEKRRQRDEFINRGMLPG